MKRVKLVVLPILAAALTGGFAGFWQAKAENAYPTNVLGKPEVAAIASKPVFVTIGQGRLQGVSTAGVASFKGIPFAAPPVGKLRWRAPAAPISWPRTRDATQFGHSCMQPAWPGAAEIKNQSEDCLTLNVWKQTPLRRADKRPVMVWIHGGGMYTGASADPIYDGTHFAEHGVVLVSLNYRLGNFGFFAHPALTAEDPTGPLGNFAVLDVIAALHWIKENIKTFGGDPDNITIFGESAGGCMVNLLMTSPKGKGLFNKAIVESGRARLGLSPIRGDAPDTSEKIGSAFASSQGINEDSPDAARALRSLPAEKVKQLFSGIGSARSAWPMIDGKIVVEDPANAFATGREALVPYLAGSNSWESSAMPSAAKDPEGFLARLGPLRAKVTSAYGGDIKTMAQNVKTDVVFSEPVRAYARLHTRNGAPAYTYYFSYLPETLRGKQIGANHAFEVPFVFNTLSASGLDLFGAKIPAPTAKDRAIAIAMITYWTNFAKTGRPGASSGVVWPTMSPNDTYLEFGNDGVRLVREFRRPYLETLTEAPEGMRLP